MTSSAVHIIILFWLPIRVSLQALYPLLDVIGYSWNPGVPYSSSWLPWLTASVMAWQPSCTVFLKASICACLPAQLNRFPSQTQHFLPCSRESLIPIESTKEHDGLPWRQDHGFSYPISWPGLLEYVGDQTSSPCMGQWGLIILSIPQHYSHLDTIVSSILRGRGAVSSMLRGY